MKKLGLFLVSLALFCFVALNACKSTTPKADEAHTEEVVEEVVDTAAVADTAAVSEADSVEIEDEAVEEAHE